MSTGLILVDIQNDYFPGGKLPLIGMKEATQHAGELLTTFRENGQPTFHIQHIETHPNAPLFVVDTDGANIHESVRPREGDLVIQKHHPNSFLATSLLDDLRGAGIERVVICGAMSHMCIDATTRAASDYGFDCVVAHDACATKNLEFGGKAIPAEDVHHSFMSALGAAYARVVTASEALSIT